MKKVKSILIAFILLFSLTACSKTNFNINIDSQGEVTLTHTILLNEDEFDNVNNIIGITNNKFEYKNYLVEKINEEKMTGYKISGNIGRIDKISSNRSNIIELTEYTSETFPIRKMFEKKNRLLYTTYVGHFSVDLTDMDKVLKHLPFDKGISYNFNDSNIIRTSVSNDTARRLNENVAATVSLNVVGLVGKNNAHDNIGGMHIWELEFGKVNEIYFEVSKINRSTFSIFIILFILFICLFVIYLKHKNIKNLSNITLRESLDKDYNSEIKDIYSDYHDKKKKEFDVDNINYKINGSNTNIIGYQNQKDIDKLKEKYSKIGKKKEIVSINEQINPNFRLVDDQVKEQLNKEENKHIKEKNKKFIK